jgi:calcium-dependent protein kinase
MAAMNQEKLLSMKKIEQAFKICDLDGDGFISKQELESVMGELEESLWVQMLSEADNN